MAEAWSFSDIAKLPSVDVALVLGTAPIGPEGGPNRYFVYRLDAAAALWKAGKAKYFIVSGSGEEPAAMRAGLIERGVPAEAIYRDPAGYRTWDSVLRARDVYGQKRIVIVSQRFHLDRALFSPAARASRPGAWRRATSIRPTASSPNCAAIRRRCAPTTTCGRTRRRARAARRSLSESIRRLPRAPRSCKWARLAPCGAPPSQGLRC